MRIGGPGPCWSRRRSRIRGQWPTSLPGISFCVRGTLTYRARADFRPGGASAARAAARLALDKLGRGITQHHTPEQLNTAQERLTLAAAHWQTVEDAPGLWMKARVTLMLAKQDAARAQRYQDALRDVTLKIAQENERRERFRQSVFDKPDAARIWWLDRHLDDLESLNWDVFKEKILPLVGAADDIQAQAERMAQTFLYIWEKLGDTPGQHARFITTVRTVLDQMGWTDAPLPMSSGATADSINSGCDGGELSRVADAATTQ